MPALFTRISTRPYAATTLVMNAWTCPRSATSTANPAALPPAALISSTTGGIAPSFLVGNDDKRPFAREALRNRLANARGRAGHDRDFFFQAHRHLLVIRLRDRYARRKLGEYRRG